MARKERFQKRPRKGNVGPKHRPELKYRKSSVRERDATLETCAKKQKVNETDENESDSAGESDHYSNLLSSFNVSTEKPVIETDESDATDNDDEDADSEIASGDDDSYGSGDHVNSNNSDNSVDSNKGEFDVDSDDDDEVTDDNDHTAAHSTVNDDYDDNADEQEDCNGTDDSDENCQTPESASNNIARDPFVSHFKYDISETLVQNMQSVKPLNKVIHEHWPMLGSLQICLPEEKKVVTVAAKLIDDENVVHAPIGCVPQRINGVDFSKLHVKSQLHNNIANANMLNVRNSSSALSPLQKEIFTVVNNYQDLYFPSRTLDNGEEIRFIYCLHAVNHVLKTRTKIVHHNLKIQNRDDVPDEFRDQGLVRPKVLILVPFKDSAFRIVKTIISLLHPDDKGHVINKSKFIAGFTGGELQMPHKNPRPEDYEKTFSGNTDDNFRIGMSITRKSLKLYVNFYSADIIVASPLGLRLIIGAEGEQTRDYDFLASLEVLILDQTELFLMQNWEHVLHVMNHLHLQPKESHGTDFARVRSWAINGWTRFYRQTLMFSSHTLPEINALFNKKCNNYAGKVRVEKYFAKGSVCQVVVQVSQIFQRFTPSGGQSVIDSRFEYFTKKILPQFTNTNTSHVLIYVPSYFDYVRIRNYLKREDMSFVQICEYSKDNKIARARDLFYHNEEHFLLYSERAHFFRRSRIKGIRHLIFYQPPTFPHFYSELCNFMAEGKLDRRETFESSKNVTVLFAKSDGLQISAIVGTARAARMLSSDRDVHMFVSGQ